MFDTVRNNKRIVQIFLTLIALSFAVWGLEAYQRGGGVAKVARVGKADILLAQYQENLRMQQDQLRRQLPPGTDASVLDTPEIRERVLEGVIRQQLLHQEVDRQNLAVDINLLREMIFQIPNFQENGRFSQERYRIVLAQNGMTPEGFEAKALKDLQFQVLVGSLSVSAFIPRTVSDRMAELLSERRSVQEFLLPWQTLAAKVKVNQEDLQAYYDDHSEQFSLPEQARVEYVVLEDDPEKRRASHILLLTNEGSDKAKVKEEAEKLLAEVKKDPRQFAALAKQHSQDPGSAANGGDLGFFPQGMMVKPFNDAVFGMKEGDISSLVETDFGYHIIQLTGIQPGRYGARSFAQVEEDFSESVYNSADGLKPTADEFGLTLQKSGWLTRQSAKGNGVLDHPGFLKTVFDEEVIKNGRNSKAVEVSPGVMVAARILEYQPASVRPFKEVRGDIEAQIIETRAMELAVSEGTALLGDAKAGKGKITWSAEQTVSRDRVNPQNGMVMDAIFRADVTGKLPVYTGVRLPQVGYAIYKITQVTPGDLSEEERKMLADQLGSFAGRAQLAAYVDALRTRYRVNIYPEMLAKEKD